jgi:alpha-glucosidase
MLHYPDDPGSRAEQYEFMLGDRILVAPVIVDKARGREVYFPPGEWVSFWDGKHYQGQRRTRVSAPLEEIPIFVKNNSIIPIFDSQIDTLAKEDRPNLNGWDDANKSIKVLFFGSGADDFTIWDGTRFHCDSVKKICQMSDSPLPRSFSFEFK